MSYLGGALVFLLCILCSCKALLGGHTNTISGQFSEQLGTHSSHEGFGYSPESSLNGFSFGVGSLTDFSTPGINHNSYAVAQPGSFYDSFFPYTQGISTQVARMPLATANNFGGGSFGTRFGGTEISGLTPTGNFGNNPIAPSGFLNSFHETSYMAPPLGFTFNDRFTGNSFSSGVLGSSFAPESGVNSHNLGLGETFVSDRQFTDNFPGSTVTNRIGTGNLRAAIDDITSALLHGFGSTGSSNTPAINNGVDFLSPLVSLNPGPFGGSPFMTESQNTGFPGKMF